MQQRCWWRDAPANSKRLWLVNSQQLLTSTHKTHQGKQRVTSHVTCDPCPQRALGGKGAGEWGSVPPKGTGVGGGAGKWGSVSPKGTGEGAGVWGLKVVSCSENASHNEDRRQERQRQPRRLSEERGDEVSGWGYKAYFWLRKQTLRFSRLRCCSRQSPLSKWTKMI